MIHIEADSHGLTLNIGTQRVRLDADDTAVLADLAAGPDGDTWSQSVLRVAEGSTVRTVLADRHGSHVTVAIGLDDTFTAARITAGTLTRAMQGVTVEGVR